MWYSPSHGLIKTPKAIVKDGIQHPRQIFRKWSKAELANIGFHPARLSVEDHRYYNTSGEDTTLMQPLMNGLSLMVLLQRM